MVQKTAYLTIDDGPSKDFRQKLDFLLSKGIPAIWFCQGNHMEQREADVVYAIKQGFVIGNHAYSHRKFSDLTVEECFEEIKKTDEILEHIYMKASVTRPARLFRFPYGDKGGLKYGEVLEPYDGEGKIRKDKIQAFLRELGYNQPAFPGITYMYFRDAGLLDDVDWYWTYDVMEYALRWEEPRYGIDSIEKVYARMDEDFPDEGRGLNLTGSEEIILTHDHEWTTEFFEGIIERLLAKGLMFKLPEF